MNTYRIFLNLTEDEFLALARLGYKELRPLRAQAHYILRSHLTKKGLLHGGTTVFNPAPEVPPDESIIPNKKG